MDFVRIGEKIVSRRKLLRIIDKILNLRTIGLSQLEVAKRLNIDRTLISRLENLGEIHKGQRIAVLGFPVANKQELTEALNREGIEFVFLLTEEERWSFVRNHQGPELLDRLVKLLAEIRSYDVVILLGSDQRIRNLRSLLDQEIVEMEIGQSPITENKIVPVEELIGLIRLVKDGELKSRSTKEVAHEARS